MEEARLLPLPGAEDTIVALATPLGRSALAVLRLSGPGARSIAERVLEPWLPRPRTPYLATLRDPLTGAAIDRPLVTLYAAPRSYTGDDIVELSLHGGHLAPSLGLAALLAAGAREALPGEFTRRAVARGKMDILQAEGIGDLIDAQSRAMHQAALEQLDGGLSRRITALRDALVHLEALIAYDIDFPEEDEGPVSSDRVTRAIGEVMEPLEALLASAHTGEVVRRGAVVVIAGAPNAGKSSLFNALLGSTRAIVTEIPGTTRDAIEAVIDVGDWPVRLVDTAGLRESADVVERLGIEVTERYLRDADVILTCGSSEESLGLAVDRVRSLTPAAIIAVRTKADLVANGDYMSARDRAPGDIVSEGYEMTPPGRTVRVSAVARTGLDELSGALASLLTELHGGRRADVPLLTRERHRVAVQRARDEVALFAEAWGCGSLPPTVAAVHLHEAAAALESLIGAVDVEDILDRVFSTFCVGK